MKRKDILIEADELLERINDRNMRIYDATILFFREEHEPTAAEKYAEAHIPNAAFFDHQQFSDPNSDYMYMVLPEKDLATQIGKIGISEDVEVIFYSSNRLVNATRAWWVLRYAGHDNVRVLNGGLEAWQAAGGDIEVGTKHYEASHFECKLRPEMFASKDDVLVAMNDENVHTEYSLPLEAYEGKHITGSSCLPVGNLMQNGCALLPNDELIPKLGRAKETERIITYCGGGIAATVNAIAHLLVGNENVAVYDGSMSEWMGEGLPTSE